MGDGVGFGRSYGVWLPQRQSAADLGSKEGYGAKDDTGSTYNLAANSVECRGLITYAEPGVGGLVSVKCAGPGRFRLGGTVTRGAKLEVGADGRWVLATGTGRALAEADEDGGAGDLIDGHIVGLEAEPHLITWQKDAADAAAATATAEQAVWKNTSGRTRKLGKVSFLPSAALTAHADDNATITVRKRQADGGTPVTLVAITTNIAHGNWVAFAEKDFGALAVADLEAGASITLQIAKNGNGVAVSAGTLLIQASP